LIESETEKRKKKTSAKKHESEKKKIAIVWKKLMRNVFSKRLQPTTIKA